MTCPRPSGSAGVGAQVDSNLAVCAPTPTFLGLANLSSLSTAGGTQEAYGATGREARALADR